MGANSKIGWCDDTNNLWWGCVEVHSGCDECYARTLAHRWGYDIWGNDKPRRAIPSVWDNVRKQQEMARSAGEIRREFVGSMMDIFEKPMPLINSKGEKLPGTTGELRDRYFNEVIPNTPDLLHLLLTKRPSCIPKFIPEAWKQSHPQNVMYGTSISNQDSANRFVPLLVNLPGRNARFFLSVEPLLGPVDISKYLNWWRKPNPDQKSYSMMPPVHWVIVGGESGSKARHMNPDWARSVRDQCLEAKVPFFFKQWGAQQEGNELDGQYWEQFPEHKKSAA